MHEPVSINTLDYECAVLLSSSSRVKVSTRRLPRCLLGVVNGPLKNEKSRQILPKSRISHNLQMGLGISDFVSVGHIFAFLSSRYTFSSRSRILKCQSRRLGESRIYHSPPLLFSGSMNSREKIGTARNLALLI